MMNGAAILVGLLLATAQPEPAVEFQEQAPNENDVPTRVEYSSGAFHLTRACGFCVFDARLRMWTGVDDGRRRDVVAPMKLTNSTDGDTIDFVASFPDGTYAIDLVSLEERTALFDEPATEAVQSFVVVEHPYTVFFSVTNGSLKEVGWPDFACATPPTTCERNEDGVVVVNLHLATIVEEPR